MSNKTAFVAISFHKKFKNVYDAAIKPAIEANGYVPLRANGEDIVLRDIYEDIAIKIASAEIVIVDISKVYDDDGRLIDLNNVYYELGLAHGISKRCIFLAQNINNDVAFDLRRLGGISYDSDDLFSLKDELTLKISKAMSEDPVKIFKDKELVTPEMRAEINYLKQESKKIIVNIYPPTADIFFNDKYLGQAPQTIYVNSSQTVRNTISIAAPSLRSYFELHREISTDEIRNGIINIKLDKYTKEGIHQRVSGWLSYRSKDTKNPVLTRAISQYLFAVKDDNAITETEELLKIAPEWYLSYNQMGFITQDNNKSLEYYKIATAMNPDSFIGYYNQACIFAKQEKYEEAIEKVKQIENPLVLKSYAFTELFLSADTDFDNIKKDAKYGEIFMSLVETINNKARVLRKEFEVDC